MSRKARVLVPEVVYHVGSRGVEKRQIFDVFPGDRAYFLDLLATVVRTYCWRLHAYCLMGNHFHLAVETPDANLSDGMQYLKGRYAQWFNMVNLREGALFERRYFSEMVDTEPYLHELCRYIVLNPVRAGLTRAPEDWPWSSYSATVGLAPVPAFLFVDDIRAWFGGERGGTVRYARFVGEGLSRPRAA
jgi:REP element-mobilizing transposase RayT